MTQYGDTWIVHPNDIRILRDLLKRKREIAADPIMAERRQVWTEHASLRSRRPMILAETSGVLDECVPLSTLRCQPALACGPSGPGEAWARGMERGLRDLIFRYESVGDDFVVEPRIRYGWFIETGDFGVQTEHRRGENEGRLGSYKVDPPIKDLDRDFHRLHFRSLRVDREKTAAWASLLGELFGDILPAVNRGWYWWTTGLTITAIDLIGMEQMLIAMVENPAGLHRLMAFLRDDMLHYLDWFEAEGLLPLNNEDDYVGSGSIGYTSELPASDRQPGQPVRVRDLWGLSESQETVGVSPRMFEEFVFQYQYPIISRFGLSYYGCCEPIDRRIKIIKRLPNLRRLSVSPWCNQQVMADELGKDYIFCRKPAPSMISTAAWDEDAIREDLRTTLRIARGCPLEFAMKDVHTLADQPWRLGRWVQIAREVCDE
jgi:hypothetical protein